MEQTFTEKNRWGEGEKRRKVTGHVSLFCMGEITCYNEKYRKIEGNGGSELKKGNNRCE